MIVFFILVVFISWPKARLSRISSENRDYVRECAAIRQSKQENSNESSGLISDVALMIATHNSCLTADRTKVFKNTLRCALQLFPPEAIFVCDNGRGSRPSDRTEVAELLACSVFRC